HGIGKGWRAGVPLGAELERQCLDTPLGSDELAGGELGRIGAVLESCELQPRLLSSGEQLVVCLAAETALCLRNPVELGLELLEPAGLRFERGQEGMEVGSGLTQAELDVAELVPGALQLGGEAFERRNRAFRNRHK